PVTFIGAVGDDDFGRTAWQGFQSENLVCDFLKTVPGTASGVALILVDERGQNLISVAAGAKAFLTPAKNYALPHSAFPTAPLFLTCLETPFETVARALERAKRAGLLTILNPAPAARDVLDTGMMALVDVVTPNAGEAALLTLGKIRSDDTYDE